MNACCARVLAPPAPGNGDARWHDECVLTDGRSVRVRPLSERDEDAEQAFFGGLSAASRFRRFHVGLRDLPPAMLHAMTHIDQQQHVALVAEHDERIVADARYVRLADSGDADFAVAVADDWQRQGLGRLLVERLLQHARAQGVRGLVGDVLWDNRPMIAMVRELGGEFIASAGGSGVLHARFAL